MIIVLERGTTEEQAKEIQDVLESYGLQGRYLATNEKPLIHVHQGPTRFARHALVMEYVEGLVPTSGPRVRREGRRFYPYHFLNWSAATLLLMGLLVVLAGFFPPGLGTALDIRQAPATTATSWYVRALDRLEALLPPWLLGLLLAALFLGLLLLPLLDRSEGRGLRTRWPAAVAVGALFVGVLVLVLP